MALRSLAGITIFLCILFGLLAHSHITQVPEAMGAVSSTVFLAIMFFFIPMQRFTSPSHENRCSLTKRAGFMLGSGSGLVFVKIVKVGERVFRD